MTIQLQRFDGTNGDSVTSHDHENISVDTIWTYQ